jgi:hypothetical protein
LIVIDKIANLFQAIDMMYYYKFMKPFPLFCGAITFGIFWLLTCYAFQRSAFIIIPIVMGVIAVAVAENN